MSQPIFSTRILVLMAIGIALNMALGQLVAMLKLPVFLDSLGTMLVAVLCGPWIGGLTGLVTNLIWGLVPLAFQIMGRMGIGAWELLAHRTLWAAPTAFLFVAMAGQTKQLAGVLRNGRTMAWLKERPEPAREGLLDGLARRLATALVEARLAACASVLPPMRSVYRWQGALEAATGPAPSRA